ncbi:MAG: response regulator transcription factor [Pyrinomonadaceae bacterium]
MEVHTIRILCVEDNKDSRDVLTRLLIEANANYVVTAVETAAEALALDSRGGFDLYILDIWLPGMDGVDMCRRLRERGRTAPIMFFSAMGMQPADREYLLAAGANAFLIKSVDIDLLIPTVQRLLAESIAPPADGLLNGAPSNL